MVDDLILVGHVTGAYGIHGWVRIRPYSNDADALLRAKTWWLDTPDLHDVERLQAKLHGGDVVAQIVGIADRNAAERMQGATVSVRRAHFPPLGDQEFYWVDLIGSTVDNLQGFRLGIVSGLMDNGAHPILKVTCTENGTERERLVPFVDQFVKSVDTHGKSITVDWDADF